MFVFPYHFQMLDSGLFLIGILTWLVCFFFIFLSLLIKNKTKHYKDVEMIVSEPKEEICSVYHNHTTSGAILSREFTGGYGPVEYLVCFEFVISSLYSATFQKVVKPLKGTYIVSLKLNHSPSSKFISYLFISFQYFYSGHLLFAKWVFGSLKMHHKTKQNYLQSFHMKELLLFSPMKTKLKQLHLFSSQIKKKKKKFAYYFYIF